MTKLRAEVDRWPLKTPITTLFANANSTDVVMSVEDLEAVYAAPSFASRDLVTV